MNVYEVITNRIITSLEAGTVPWRTPWTTSTPINMVSKKAYRGINVFLLGCSGYSSNLWLSFKQAKDKGGCVRKGEHYTPVFFSGFYVKDRVTKKIRFAGKNEPGAFFMSKFFQVFNVSQCDGIEVPVGDAAKTEFEQNQACENVVSSWMGCPDIEHGGIRACYIPSQDKIQMPEKVAFTTPAEYYSTLFHEMTHSTGASKRLDRKGITDTIMFGSHNYSFEELVAECGAAFLCGRTGILNQTIDNSAAYIASWISKLKSDPKWVIDAAGQASKAADMIMGAAEATPEKEEE